MKQKNPKVRAVFIRIPFWMKWLKRFIRLELKEYSLPKKLKGQKIDFMIVDGIGENIVIPDYKVV